LRFSWQCCWWFRFSGMWCCVTGWVVPDVWKDHGLFSFQGKQSTVFLDCLLLKTVSWSFQTSKNTFLMFIGPCIVIYFYSETNQMHQCIKLFYFGMTLYMFRSVFPSIIRSSRLYIQQQASVKQILLSAYWRVPASKQTAVSVCTVLNSWWWTERPSEKCSVTPK
jgi:hypothetical protein